jgi:hypothetical protein
MRQQDCLEETTTPAFFLVEKCDRFLFWSKVEAAYGLETVITVITVIDSPHDHMDIDPMAVFVVVVVVRVELSPSVVEFFLAYLGPCVS